MQNIATQLVNTTKFPVVNEHHPHQFIHLLHEFMIT
jgi:hypothetical protein